MKKLRRRIKSKEERLPWKEEGSPMSSARAMQPKYIAIASVDAQMKIWSCASAAFNGIIKNA